MKEELRFYSKASPSGPDREFSSLIMEVYTLVVLYPVHVLYVLFTILYGVITISNNKVIVNEVRLRCRYDGVSWKALTPTAGVMMKAVKILGEQLLICPTL